MTYKIKIRSDEFLCALTVLKRNIYYYVYHVICCIYKCNAVLFEKCSVTSLSLCEYSTHVTRKVIHVQSSLTSYRIIKKIIIKLD